jgi:hypothetical protein
MYLREKYFQYDGGMHHTMVAHRKTFLERIRVTSEESWYRNRAFNLISTSDCISFIMLIRSYCSFNA